MIPTAWLDDRAAQFPVTRDWIYLDHAGVAPLCGAAAAGMRAVVDGFAARGAADYERWNAVEAEARTLAGELVGVPAARIAWVPNTSAGLSIASAGYDWQRGDQVILATGEFPSNVYPWLSLQAHGVEVVPWPLGADDEEALSTLDRLLERHPNARMVAFSWVQYHTGRVLPLAAIARRVRQASDALVIVDGIQGLGVLHCRADDWGVDLIAADGHKWLLGPEGFGLVGLSARALDRLRPSVVGWHTVAEPFPFDEIDWTPAPDARRYEPGTWNLVGMAGLLGGLRALKAGHQPSIRAHIMGLLARVWDALDVTPPSYAVAAHAFVPLAGGLSRAALLDEGIVANVRGGRLRLSPHGYVSTDEIDRAIAAIERLRQRAASA